MNCKYCQRVLPPSQPGGHRKREYCNDACKQAYYRSLRQQEPMKATDEELEQAKARIAELEQQVTHLKYLLDVEKWYHQDTQARGFKSWLRKQAPSSLSQKLLADALLPPRGSRAFYEAYLRKSKYSQEDIHEFKHLWLLMLLSQS